MPLFDFQCARCGNVQEHLVFGAEVPRCPSCGGEELRKFTAIPAPAGKSREMIARARQRAEAAGHLSHFSASERRRGG